MHSDHEKMLHDAAGIVAMQFCILDLYFCSFWYICVSSVNGQLAPWLLEGIAYMGSRQSPKWMKFLTSFKMLNGFF